MPGYGAGTARPFAAAKVRDFNTETDRHERQHDVAIEKLETDHAETARKLRNRIDEHKQTFTRCTDEPIFRSGMLFLEARGHCWGLECSAISHATLLEVFGCLLPHTSVSQHTPSSLVEMPVVYVSNVC